MSFTEGIVGAARAVRERLAPSGDRRTVALKDLEEDSEWRNKYGSRLRVITLDPLDLTLDGQQFLLADREALRAKLEDEGYVLEVERAPEETDAPEGGKAMPVKGVPVVIEVDSVDEGEQRTVLCESQVEAYEAITRTLDQAKDIIQGMKPNNKNRRYTATIVSLVDRAKEINNAIDDTHAQQGENHRPTAEDIVQERKWLADLQDVLRQSTELVAKVDPSKKGETVAQVAGDPHAQNENRRGPARGRGMEVLAEIRGMVPHAEDEDTVPPVGTAGEGASGVSATVTGEVAEGAGAQSAIPKDGEGGSDKREGSEQFGSVLGALHEERANAIKEVTTPQEFAEMRRRFFLAETDAPGRESGRGPQRFFLRFNDIKARVGTLGGSDIARVMSSEEELRRLAEDKFGEVLRADLDKQYENAIRILNRTRKEFDVDTLATKWATSHPVVNSWKDFSENLIADEQKTAEVQSAKRLGAVMHSLEKRRARLHDKQELADFLKNPEGRTLADRCWEILTSEWNYFLDDLKRHRIQLSDGEISEEWNLIYLPVIRERIVVGLMKQSSVSEEQARAILRAIENDLEQSGGAKYKKKS